MLNIESMLSGDVRRLSHIRRFSSNPVIRPENVAEHSFYVGIYANLIANDLIYECNSNAHPSSKLYVTLPLECAAKALYHDLDECVTGDIIRTFKHADSDLSAMMHKVSCKMIMAVGDDLGMPEHIQKSWINAKDETLSGRIVNLADLLTVIAYGMEEVKMGNLHMSPVLTRMKTWLSKLLDQEKIRPVPLSKYIQSSLDLVEAHVSYTSATLNGMEASRGL